MNATVTVYSATWCAFCHAAKEYLDKLGVKYTDKDVEASAANLDEAVTKSGQRGIPVIDIAGNRHHRLRPSQNRRRAQSREAHLKSLSIPCHPELDSGSSKND